MREETCYTIGCFAVDTERHSVLDDDGQVFVMQPKMIEVLTYLAKQFPRLVSRDELIEQVWLGNHYVGDKALTNAVWHIRRILHVHNEEYIETVRKSGYRLIQAPRFTQISVESLFEQQKASIFARKSHRNTISAILILVVMGFFLSVYFGSEKNAEFATPEIFDVTGYPGREVYPAISNDGKKMAFLWRSASHNPDLYVKDLTQPDLPPTQITFDQDVEFRPAWGSDDNTIYYIRKSWDRSLCHVVALDLKTMSHLSLAECKPRVHPALAMSLDGLTLAYNGFDPENNDPGIYFINLADANAVPYRFSCSTDCGYTDREIAFSPDGKMLAVVRRFQEHDEDIYLINRDTGESTQLTKGQLDIHGLAWHPNGHQLVFSAGIANRREGYVTDVESAAVTALNVSGFSHPQFVGPNGDVMFHQWNLNEHLYRLDIGGEARSLPFPLMQSDYEQYSVHYSATVDKIAYVSNESGFNEVWVANRDGSERVQLTQLQSNVFFPRWSPDGRKVAFLVRHLSSERNNINIVDAHTRFVNAVESDFVRFDRPNWTLNGKELLVAGMKDERWGFYRLAIDGSHSTLLFEEPDADFAVQINETDYVYSTSRRSLHKFMTGTNNVQHRTLLGENSMSSGYSWLVADDAVMFLENHAKHQQINTHDPVSGSTKAVLMLPLRSISSDSSFNFIAATQTLIFTQSLSPQVDIKRLRHPLLAQ